MGIYAGDEIAITIAVSRPGETERSGSLALLLVFGQLSLLRALAADDTWQVK